MKLKCVLVLTLVSTTAAAAETDGKKLFQEQKCTQCHAIKSQGIERVGGGEDAEEAPDLSAVGKAHDKKWIAKFLMKQEAKDGKKHKKTFQGTTDDLKVIATWLEGCKGP